MADVRGTRALEAMWIRTLAHGDLMQRAGSSVARWTLALAPHARRIWLACGPGGNGGDGLYAAAALARTGRDVLVTMYDSGREHSEDVEKAVRAARETGVRIDTTAPAGKVDVAVDALLGIGARPEPNGGVLDGVHALQRCEARRFAVDIPTGLNPDTGVTSHAGQVTAEATLALLTLRPGMVTGSGRDACGAIWLDTLGLDDTVAWRRSAVARLTHAGEHPAYALNRPHASHKGRFGDVQIVGGAAGMTGAAKLAALAAQSAGAGRTWVSLLDPTAPCGDAARPEWLWRAPEQLDIPGLLETVTMVCGCGAGSALDRHLDAWLNRPSRLVLDADGLNALGRYPASAQLLRDRAARGRHTVLTPHPLEAARLLGVPTDTVQADRLDSARRLAEIFHATVVLKGSGTVIATPGELTAINSTGGPALASAGTGDVLAGWIGGLWSQAALEPGAATGHSLVHAIACSAVWLHGLAADAWPSHQACRAADLVEAMRAVSGP